VKKTHLLSSKYNVERYGAANGDWRSLKILGRRSRKYNDSPSPSPFAAAFIIDTTFLSILFNCKIPSTSLKKHF
jgi:hypothetical protein